MIIFSGYTFYVDSDKSIGESLPASVPSIPEDTSSAIPAPVETVPQVESDSRRQRAPNLNQRSAEIFAAAIASGKNQSQAAIIAGYSPKSAGRLGCRLAKNPLVRRNIQALLAKHHIGPDFVMKELRKGLREGKVGGHAEYLRLLLQVNGMLSSRRDAPTLNVQVNNLMQEAKDRGLDVSGMAEDQE